MDINQSEKLMYDVMKTVYESGIPINFKGSLVLKACLSEFGYLKQTRHTVDIDANWNSTNAPTMEQMEESLQKAFDKNGLNLKINAYREYGKGRSAGFEIKDKETEELIFTMDIDVNRPEVPTRIYEIEGIKFIGVSPIQMIADKTFVVSTDKVFRRVKDVVDLYYLSHVFKFDKIEVQKALQNIERELGNFNGFLYQKDELRHSYEKFRFEGNVEKPPFDKMYETVKNFVFDVIPVATD